MSFSSPPSPSPLPLPGASPSSCLCRPSFYCCLRLPFVWSASFSSGLVFISFVALFAFLFFFFFLITTTNYQPTDQPPSLTTNNNHSTNQLIPSSTTTINNNNNNNQPTNHHHPLSLLPPTNVYSFTHLFSLYPLPASHPPPHKKKSSAFPHKEDPHETHRWTGIIFKRNRTRHEHVGRNTGGVFFFF